MKTNCVPDHAHASQSNGLPFSAIPAIIGRGTDAAIRIDDRWASRHNSEIFTSDGSLFVRDLNSRFGTLVNGQHVTEAILAPGDCVTVGMTTFVVSQDGQSLTAHSGPNTSPRRLVGELPKKPR